MSRSIEQNIQSPNPPKVDAVVLAGTEGSEPFELESGKIYKPLLKLDGETLVLRAVKAALQSRGIGRVYVVGDSEQMSKALSPLKAVQDQGRLKIVEQTGDLVHNSLGTFFDHILVDHGLKEAKGAWTDPSSVRRLIEDNPSLESLGVLVLASDLPFISSKDIETFMTGLPDETALCAGLCDHAELVRMQEVLGKETILDRWKLGAIPIRSREVRWNNLWFARPLAADPALYNLLQDVYSHRYLLHSSGKVRWKNWWSIVKSVARHGIRMHGKTRFARGFFNLACMMFASGMARLAGKAGRVFAWPFRTVLGQRDLEFVASMVLDVKVNLLIGGDVAPAVDVDVPEIYLALTAHGEENYRRVMRYLGRLSDDDLQRLQGTKKPELKIIAGGKS